MKLKRLEISGFKSFREKVVVDFSSGVNAIVGPNGCGTSNIVDAIRWVIGEHKIRALRSQNLDDLIFKTGTANKFEEAIKQLGFFLGFVAQRPENDFGRGPDNLCIGGKQNYFVIECQVYGMFLDNSSNHKYLLSIWRPMDIVLDTQYIHLILQ